MGTKNKNPPHVTKYIKAMEAMRELANDRSVDADEIAQALQEIIYEAEIRIGALAKSK